MILNRKSPDVFKDVAKFTELAQPNMLPENGVIKQKAIELAINLIEEECNKEYIPALKAFSYSRSQENLITVIDGAMDSIYVIAWAMKVLGINGAAFWNEVQRSNMAKFPIYPSEKYLVVPLDIPEYADIEVELNIRNGRAVLTNAQTGKVVKPQGWTQPDLFRVAQELESIQKMRTMPDAISTSMYPEYFNHMEDRIEKGEIDG